MKISINISAIAQTKWYEYLSRFAFGGAATAIAGIIAKKYGPAVGGLFLAFPAIFPASATLVESHEAKKKRRQRGHGTLRGRRAAALDATGASLGSFGLLAFSVVVWKSIGVLPIWCTLPIAILAWLVTTVTAWKIWEAF